MKLLILLYQKEMAVIFLIISLMIWSVASSFLAFQNKSQIILIGKTDEAYKLITEEEITPIETGNFIRHFLSLTLNFNNESYKRHISLAGDLMTEELWKSKKPEFIEMAGFIKKNKVSQSSELLKIQKVKKDLYEIEVKNYLFKNGILTKKTNLFY